MATEETKARLKDAAGKIRGKVPTPALEPAQPEPSAASATSDPESANDAPAEATEPHIQRGSGGLLTAQMARSYLSKAGDKDKAREMARADGWQF